MKKRSVEDGWLFECEKGAKLIVYCDGQTIGADNVVVDDVGKTVEIYSGGSLAGKLFGYTRLSVLECDEDRALAILTAGLAAQGIPFPVPSAQKIPKVLTEAKSGKRVAEQDPGR